MKKLLSICPFSSCKEFNHSDPRALMDHIMTCAHSSDIKICCAGCKKYKAHADQENEPANLHLETEREPDHLERDMEPSARMNLRRPFRKLSSLFQASIRPNHSTASSSPTGSIVSAASPRNSRISSPSEQEVFQPSPLPCQTYLCELAETSPGELGDTSRPHELGGGDVRPVEHPAELAVQATAAPRHELAGPVGHRPRQSMDLRLRQHRFPSSPPPIQTNHASETSVFCEEIHGGWAQDMNSDETFFGNGLTESPSGLRPEDPESFNIFQSFNHGSFSDMDVSPIGSINMSPSSSQGHAQQVAGADLVPQAYNLLGATEGPSRQLQHGIWSPSDYLASLQSNFAAPFSSQTPVHEAQSSWSLINVNTTPQAPGEHGVHSQTRTDSWSTVASSTTYASARTGSPSDFVDVAPRPVPGPSVLDKPDVYPNFAAASSDRRMRPSPWSCKHRGCNFHPSGIPKNWPSYMRKHKSKHQPKKHKCQNCGSMLSRRDNLNTHLKRCKGVLGRWIQSSNVEEPRCLHGEEEQAWLGGST
jgi:hypothetical protein